MKLVAYLPWFTFLFTLIASVVMYIAATDTPGQSVKKYFAVSASPFLHIFRYLYIRGSYYAGLLI